MTSDKSRGRLLLQTARSAWERMADIRRRRRRFCRFTYGDPWSDTVRDREGTLMSEGDFSRKQGQEPLTNNLIRRLVKAVVGRFRMERAETTTDATSKTTDATAEADPSGLNRLDELDARTLEEFLVSGIAVHRVCREKRPAGMAAWADNISPDRFFINRFRDPRATDVEFCGFLRDLSPGELLMRFARGSERRAGELKRLYAAFADATPSLFDTAGEPSEVSFSTAAPGRCRVIEVWALESRERYRCHDPLKAVFSLLEPSHMAAAKRENTRRRRLKLPQMEFRWEMAAVWRCYMLAPDGTILDSFDSPLRDGQLPYAIKFYPLVDGDVHSLVEDVIGQQKHVNRLITLMDHIMGVSAKGALLFPTQCCQEGMDWRRIANMWAEPGAVIPYNAYDGHEPHQVSTPATNIGAREMLQTQIDLFQDISGVSSSLMGKNISGAVGAARYEAEFRNSAVAILDLLNTFADFLAVRNRLLLSC